MVGKTGFEPATPWSQTRCTTKLCYFPLIFYSNGALGRNRTHNLLIRSQALYPIELQALIYGAEGRNRTGTVEYPPQDFKSCASANSATPAAPSLTWSGRRGSNPRPPPWQGGVLPLNYFRKASWATRIRTLGMTGPKPVALPLGYSPM